MVKMSSGMLLCMEAEIINIFGAWGFKAHV